MRKIVKNNFGALGDRLSHLTHMPALNMDTKLFIKNRLGATGTIRQ
jgi:hypothetical protein